LYYNPTNIPGNVDLPKTSDEEGRFYPKNPQDANQLPNGSPVGVISLKTEGSKPLVVTLKPPQPNSPVWFFTADVDGRGTRGIK
jgi:hypothetical protein